MARKSSARIDSSAFMELALTFGVEQRFTQDTPVMAQVWTKYACDPGKDGRSDLIITAHNQSSSFEIGRRIADNLEAMGTLAAARVAALRNDIAASLTFKELILVVLPLTAWWQKRFIAGEAGVDELLGIYEKISASAGAVEGDVSLYQILKDEPSRSKWHLLILIVIVCAAASVAALEGSARTTKTRKLNALIVDINKRRATIEQCGILWTDEPKRLLEKLGRVRIAEAGEAETMPPSVFSVNLNRPFTLSTHVSRQTIKADAAERLFRQDASKITWAVVDSGIDASHPAFADRVNEGRNRILKAFDFTLLRKLIAFGGQDKALTEKLAAAGRDLSGLEVLRQDIKTGRQLDWNLLESLLAIKPETRPPHPHGTHVAGIIGGDLRKGDLSKVEQDSLDADLQGICPDIKFYDLRVCDENGAGEEFVIIAALQFLSHVNRHKDVQKVHGVNLSLSIPHDAANYACGQTPVCLQANQLAADGVVVVAAAGNQGYQKFATEKGSYESYSAMNITDPGNADGVITVGSTHRDKPHAYGVSYFSSRGPTGDGRMKPDLLAPGEKIMAPIPGKGVQEMDGTSMAAPHVSGAAAMLLARHKELRRNPARIKQILCATATDLGRERSFQGAGLVDILRAMQSV